MQGISRKNNYLNLFGFLMFTGLFVGILVAQVGELVQADGMVLVAVCVRSPALYGLSTIQQQSYFHKPQLFNTLLCYEIASCLRKHPCPLLFPGTITDQTMTLMPRRSRFRVSLMDMIVIRQDHTLLFNCIMITRGLHQITPDSIEIQGSIKDCIICKRKLIFQRH